MRIVTEPDFRHNMFFIFEMMPVRLAIFDLDDTLLNGSCDGMWEDFLVEKGILDGQECQRMHRYFSKLYHQGELDIFERQSYFLESLKLHPLSHYQNWLNEFIQNIIPNSVKPKAKALINQHERAGDLLLMITASSSILTKPISEYLGFHHLIATEPEIIEGIVTGNVLGVPAFREGKRRRLFDWLLHHEYDLEDSYYYGDSCNDIPLLETVAHPIAVDPDKLLLAHANKNNWSIISLK